MNRSTVTTPHIDQGYIFDSMKLLLLFALLLCTINCASIPFSFNKTVVPDISSVVEETLEFKSENNTVVFGNASTTLSFKYIQVAIAVVRSPYQSVSATFEMTITAVIDDLGVISEESWSCDSTSVSCNSDASGALIKLPNNTANITVKVKTSDSSLENVLGFWKERAVWFTCNIFEETPMFVPLSNGLLVGNGVTFLDSLSFFNFYSQVDVSWKAVSGLEGDQSLPSDLTYDLYMQIVDGNQGVSSVAKDAVGTSLPDLNKLTPYKSFDSSYRQSKTYWEHPKALAGGQLVVCSVVARSEVETIVYSSLPLYLPSYLDTVQVNFFVIIVAVVLLFFVGIVLTFGCLSCFTVSKEPYKRPDITTNARGDPLSLVKEVSFIHSQGLPAEEMSLYGCVLFKDTFKSLCELQFITCLNVGGTNIAVTQLAKLVYNIPRLEELYLQRNGLNTLPEEIASLSDLRILDLSHNAMIDVQKHILKCTSLTHLYLAHNKISFLPALDVLSKLQVLDLNWNKLRVLNPSVVSHEDLVLLVKYNPLISIPPMLLISHRVRTSYTGLFFPRTLVIPFWLLGLKLWHWSFFIVMDIVVALVVIATIVALFVMSSEFSSLLTYSEYGAYVVSAVFLPFIFLLVLCVVVSGILAFRKIPFKVHSSHSVAVLLGVYAKDRKANMFVLVSTAIGVLFALLLESVQLTTLAFGPGMPITSGDSVVSTVLAAAYSVVWIDISVSSTVFYFVYVIACLFVASYRVLMELNSLFGGNIETAAGRGIVQHLMNKLKHIPTYIVQNSVLWFGFVQVITSLFQLPILIVLSTVFSCTVTDGYAHFKYDTQLSCWEPGHMALISLSLFLIVI